MVNESKRIRYLEWTAIYLLVLDVATSVDRLDYFAAALGVFVTILIGYHMYTLGKQE